MPIEIREGDLEKDRATLIRGLHDYLNPLTDERRFDWMYLRNPHGPARVWMAVDGENGEVVGSCGALPRLMCVGGEARLGHVMADFWIHPQLRALGPAVRLQRACLEALGAVAAPTWYDLPQRSMVAVYQRLRIPVANWLVRYTKPLRVDRWVEKLCPVPGLITGLSRTGNWVLKGRDRWRAGKSATWMVMYEGMVGEEFSSLAKEASGCAQFCVLRSAEYLNWRYGSHFRHAHRALSAYRGDRLQAYVVFLELDGHAHVVDAFGAATFGIWSDLLSSLSLVLRERGLHTVTFPILQTDFRAGLMSSLGFIARESYPIVACDAGRPILHTEAEASQVYVTYGDQTD